MPTESHLFFNQMIMKYTKYPNAAKEFLRFMMEKEQFDPWLTGAGAYVAHAAAPATRALPIWTADPKNTPYRDPVKNLRPAGYAGKLGYASAGCGGGLHRRQHGGRGDQRLEDAEGGDGAGPEARRTLLPRLTSTVAAARRGHGVANAAFVRGITLRFAGVSLNSGLARIREPSPICLP